MTDHSDEENLASLGEPEHIVRQRIKEDPASVEIAESLGVDLDDYVEQVMYYLRRPDMPAQVEVVDDEELEEAGVQLPTEGEIQTWFEQVASGEIDLSTQEGHDQVSRFTKEKDQRERIRAAMGDKPVSASKLGAQPPAAAPDAPGALVLKQQILRQQHAERVAAEARRLAAAAPDKKKT